MERTVRHLDRAGRALAGIPDSPHVESPSHSGPTVRIDVFAEGAGIDQELAVVAPLDCEIEARGTWQGEVHLSERKPTCQRINVLSRKEAGCWPEGIHPASIEDLMGADVTRHERQEDQGSQGDPTAH